MEVFLCLGLWEVCVVFEIVQVDMVVYVLLVGIDLWLVVLVGQLFLCQCGGYQVLVVLVVEYGVGDCGDVLVLLGFVEECFECFVMGWIGGEVFVFLWVVVQVVEQVGVLFGVDEFVVVVVDYYQWVEGVFGGVFVDYFVMFVVVVQVWQQ